MITTLLVNEKTLIAEQQRSDSSFLLQAQNAAQCTRLSFYRIVTRLIYEKTKEEKKWKRQK